MVNIQGKDEWVTFKKVEIIQQPLDMYSLSVKVFKTILEVSSYTTIIGVKFRKRIHIIILSWDIYKSFLGYFRQHLSFDLYFGSNRRDSRIKGVITR